MASILFTVEDIVDEVDGTRQRTKDGKRDDGADQCIGIAQTFGEHERRKDEQILRPLAGPERNEEVEEKRATALTARHPKRKDSESSRPGELSLLETFLAEHGATLRRTEGHGCFLPAG